MAASQTLRAPPSDTSTSGEYGSDEAQQHRSIDRNYQLPLNTRAVLGVFSEEALTKLRAINLPHEYNNLTEPEVLSAIVAFFSSSEVNTQLVRISDKALYEAVQELHTSGANTIGTINDFANQYFDPNGGASKALLIQSIGDLLEELYRAYIKLDELLIEAVKIEKEPPKLEPPALTVSTRPEACDVLDQSEGDQKWEPKEAPRPLELNALTDPYPIAKIVDHSDDIDPHAHLLVDKHYAVTGDGLLRQVLVPEVPSSSRHWLGDSSITLRFEGEQPNEALAEFPRFSITEVRDLESGSDYSQTDAPGYEITYTTDREKEQNFYHSPWNSDRAELCVPEIFLKLVEKFDELDCSEEEKAQLVAQVFHSQNLIYSRHKQLSKLLAACEPRHRLSLTLGLGMGDCTLLSAVLQQLLAHAQVNAVMEAGAICSEDGESYERPGHARVKVYGCESILRLDPTTWCARTISVNSMDDESLEALTEELRTADAKTCYQVGQKARKLFTTSTGSRSGDRSADPRDGDEADCQVDVDSDGDPVPKERYDPERGHQLRDDFEPQTQVALYRFLASNEQELLIAEVWEAYQEVLDSCSEEGDEAGFRTRRTAFLSEEIAANLEKEVQLVGLDQSKILEFLPKMIQTLCRNYEYVNDYEEIESFIGAIESIELRTAVFARTLEKPTRYICVFALARYCNLTPSSDSTRFLVRLIHLMTGEAAGFGLEDGGIHFNRELLLLTARFPKHYRDQIIAAYSQSYGDDVIGLVNLICKAQEGPFYSPRTFPKEVYASIFPAFRNSPVEVAKKVLDELDDYFSKRGRWNRQHIEEQYVAELLMICQYFPAHVRPELKPLVTGYVAQYLRDYTEKSIDFRVSPAVSELCDLVHINEKKTGLERQDFWEPYELYWESISNSGLMLPEHQPLLPFIRGYLLKELATLGLLDTDEIADCLYSPSKKEIKAAFDILHLARLLNGRHGGYHDSSKMHKAVQLALATLAENSRKGAVVPHAKLLKEAVSAGLINQATLDLVRIALSHRKAKVDEALLETSMPDAIAYLFSIRDSCKLRSYIRMRTACAVLDAGDGAIGSSSNVTEQVKQELLREDNSLGAKNGAYPTMAQLYCDADSRLLTLEREHQRFQTFSGAVRDGLGSIKVLHKVIQATRVTLANQKLSDDDRERACQIVSSLLNHTPVDPQSSSVLSRTNRVASHVWQDEVAKSLRLQRTEGGARILQKISQVRNDNFDSNRAYAVGDDLRAIDWRASARSDRLVVRTYQKSSRSISDSYHILLDLADVFESPEFGIPDSGVEFKMNELQLDAKMLAAVSDFIHSLAEENRPVRFSVFAFGARVIDKVISTGQERSKGDLYARTQALEALFRYAQSYAALCNAAQCVPDAYSIAGLMNPHERDHFVKHSEPGCLVLQLHGKISAGNPIDPALLALVAAGKAARVLLDTK